MRKKTASVKKEMRSKTLIPEQTRNLSRRDCPLGSSLA